MKLTQEQVKALVDYDPATGVFRWRERSELSCPDARARIRFNRYLAGTEAFRGKDLHGYRVGSVAGQFVRAHRVAWLWVYGEVADVIDHIDGDRSNNAIANLRNVTQAHNCRNRKVAKNNKSGVPGVRKHRNSWSVSVGGFYVGSFNTIEAATKARDEARNKLWKSVR